MDLHERFKNNSKDYLKEITDEASLEASIMSTVELGFENFNAAKLVDLNRKFARQSRLLTGKGIKDFIGQMVDKDMVLIVAGNKNTLRVVPADLWLDVYQDASEEGEQAVRHLMDKYINV